MEKTNAQIQELLDEFKLRIALTVDGVKYEDDLFLDVDTDKYSVWTSPTWDPVSQTFKKFNQPAFVGLTHGIHSQLSRLPGSYLSVKKDEDGYGLYNQDKRLSGLSLIERAEFSKRTTRDGTPMIDIAMDTS